MATSTAARAGAADQPPLLAAPHANHYLFSDYYLTNVLPTRPEWQSSAAASQVEQLPILPPNRYADTFHGVVLRDFIASRVLELSYTAHDLRGFAADMGYDGPPFVWDEERRLHLRCQLDALYFHLYGLMREEAGEIMDSFPIVRRQDEARFGRFRTRELVLAYYGAYAAGNMDAAVKG